MYANYAVEATFGRDGRPAIFDGRVCDQLHALHALKISPVKESDLLNGQRKLVLQLQRHGLADKEETGRFMKTTTYKISNAGVELLRAGNYAAESIRKLLQGASVEDVDEKVGFFSEKPVDFFKSSQWTPASYAFLRGMYGGAFDGLGKREVAFGTFAESRDIGMSLGRILLLSGSTSDDLSVALSHAEQRVFTRSSDRNSLVAALGEKEKGKEGINGKYYAAGIAFYDAMLRNT